MWNVMDYVVVTVGSIFGHRIRHLPQDSALPLVKRFVTCKITVVSTANSRNKSTHNHLQLPFCFRVQLLLFAV
jgi:hypothetical protein